MICSMASRAWLTVNGMHCGGERVSAWQGVGGEEGKSVWSTGIQAHLLGQVDFEGGVHDSRQQICQNISHHVLALLDRCERHPLGLGEPPRHDVYLLHWHRRRPCLFRLGSGHPPVSGLPLLPLWERNRAIRAGNQGVELRSSYTLGGSCLKVL